MPTDGDYSFSGRADDVAAVVDALGFERMIFVGHSGGGAVALHCAARLTTRVVDVLLVDPAGDGRLIPEETRHEFLEKLRSPAYATTARDYYASIAGPNADVRERVLWDLAATPPTSVIGMFEALATRRAVELRRLSRTTR